MRYSLRQLEVFLATARHQNVTRAAESLAMSQSAASGSLRELETRCGVVARVGSKVIDGSVRSRLNRLRADILAVVTVKVIGLHRDQVDNSLKLGTFTHWDLQWKWNDV